MPGDPHSGSKVWKAPDREIGKPGENRGKVIAHREFLAAILPGLADFPIKRLSSLTPSVWASSDLGNNCPKELRISRLPS
jgi:hypothetical protein